MKRSYLLILLGVTTIVIGALVYSGKVDRITNSDIFQFGVIGLLVVLALFVGISQLRSYNRNEPPEDELSKKILQKAAAKSFYVSLYLWLVVRHVTDGKDLEIGSVIGTGIVGMALVFLISWLVVKYQGIRDV